MKLSIITINYNNKEGLRRTLQSVKQQTVFDQIEHVIIDGGSTDGSVDEIKAYAQNANNVVWVSEPDKGIYNAMNKGIRKANGTYIQILNSADTLAATDSTERMLNYLDKKNAERPLAILYGNMIKCLPSGVKLRDNCGGNTRLDFAYFYRGTLNHDCAYIRRDLFERYGFYDETLRIVADWKWYMQVIALGVEHTPALLPDELAYVDIDVTHFDMTGISETAGKADGTVAQERRRVLSELVPDAILCDYERYSFATEQYNRLKRMHLWPIIHIVERVCAKVERRILRRRQTL
ncbi:MAG: glycosyltransferase family 2 protein [Bacteroidales bacterium]|nr:glycosyltransferase family 2 protein [Bacteroidales bacterium]